jgi:uroporphyrinogen decarboxylase
VTEMTQETERRGDSARRRRLVAALEHRQPDRVPLTMGSPSCSLHRNAQANLLAYLDLSPQEFPVITDNILQIVSPDERLLEYFDIDLRWLLPKEAAVEWSADKTSFVDQFGRQFVAGGGFFNLSETPLQGDSWGKLRTYSFPSPEPERFEHLGAEARMNHAMGYGLGIDGPWGVYEISSSLVGLSQYLLALKRDRALARQVSERVLERYLMPFYELLLRETAPFVQVVVISDDLGTQNGLLFSPQDYRELFKPLHQQLITHIHRISDAKVYMHSDGSIYPLIPDLIEIGVEGLNPVQYDAKDMGLARLKDEFGKDLGFFGGVVENRVLSFGTPEEVRYLVDQNMSILTPGGGFIFAPIHNISQEVPPENIVALYESGRLHDQVCRTEPPDTA